MTGGRKFDMKFSIIVVCLNPGEKLRQTLESILSQTYTDYEIVIKDGGSKDGSIDGLREDVRFSQNPRIKLYVEKDVGIYDAMNQAVAHAEGDFILFLNCGDIFYRDTVLEETACYALKCVNTGGEQQEKSAKTSLNYLVLYGDTYSEKNGVVIASAPEISGFTCYRNIPCHQSCFYAARLCKEKPYDANYRIRADYDHFLWCYYVAKAKMQHMGFPVASYEGGGYSESKENRKRDKEEHKQITEHYMGKGELIKYRLIMLATLAPLRSAMAESKLFSSLYHSIKEIVYHK